MIIAAWEMLNLIIYYHAPSGIKTQYTYIMLRMYVYIIIIIWLMHDIVHVISFIANCG